MITAFAVERIYRANRYGKRRVHIFLPGDRESWCGFRLDLDSDPSTEAEFYSPRACNACRRNDRGDLSSACVHCHLTHWSLSRSSEKSRIGFLVKRDGTKCALCGFDVPIGSAPKPLRASADHILEVRNGGCSHPRNMRLVHAFCNSVREGWPNPASHPGFVKAIARRVSA